MSTQNRDPNSEALASRLRALAHPVRLKILAALAAADTCHCGEIVEHLPLAQSTVSEHLRILRAAGLVRGETAGARSCYCLDRAAVRKLAADVDRLLAAIGRHESPGGKARRRVKAERISDARHG
jgi:ArsR family transcriptional regulator